MSATSSMKPVLSAIILAAGKATRMKSDRVKVLHEICGRPMLSYVLDACRAVNVTRLYVVIGHDRERVMETYKNDRDITWVIQHEQKGTGHAVMVCQPQIEAKDLLPALAQVQPNNKKGEYYLTDTLAILKRMDKRLEAVASVPAEDVLSINNRSELADVARVMQKRIQRTHMDNGVTLVSPE